MFEDDIRPGDYVFFATDILPTIDDFCIFRRKHATKTRGKWTSVSGFFQPVNGRPNFESPDEYFSLMDGMALRTKKDGKESGADVKTMHDEGWDYELIAVAVNLHRPLMKDRMEKTAAYTKRMQKQYDQRSTKLTADKEAQQQSMEQDRTNIVGFRQPEKSA